MRHCSLDTEGGRKRRSFSLMSSSVRPSKRSRVYWGGGEGGRKEEREKREEKRREERERERERESEREREREREREASIILEITNSICRKNKVKQMQTKAHKEGGKGVDTYTNLKASP